MPASTMRIRAGFARAAMTPPHTQATGDAAKSIANPAAATPEESTCNIRYVNGSKGMRVGVPKGRWKTVARTHTAKDALTSRTPT